MLPKIRGNPPTEADAASPVRDDGTAGADRACGACRSGQVNRGVRPHCTTLRLYADSMTCGSRAADRPPGGEQGHEPMGPAIR